MKTIGILSDTHLLSCDQNFVAKVSHTFAGCDTIIHAGDLTDLSILTAFSGKEVIAVHGNMCNRSCQEILPEYRMVDIDGYSIGICHGAGNRHNIEARMLMLFPEADCIIFGHTHSAACHTVGTTLVINPGTFMATGRYGAPGTYAILQTGPDGLKASIREVPLSL